MWDHVRGTDVDEREPPADGPQGLLRRGHALLRPLAEGRSSRRSRTRRSRSRRTTARGAPRSSGRPPTRARSRSPLTAGAYVDDVGNKASRRRRRRDERDRRRHLDDLAAAAARGAPRRRPAPHGRRRDAARRTRTSPRPSTTSTRTSQATLIHRQGHLIPESGTYTLDLYGNDWRILPGPPARRADLDGARRVVARRGPDLPDGLRDERDDRPAVPHLHAPDHIDGKRAVQARELPGEHAVQL